MLETSDPNSDVKLIDFGFAKYAHGKSVLTTPIGTPNYAGTLSSIAFAIHIFASVDICLINFG